VKISIVTPSFNQGQFIQRTIESIVEQRGEFELEYLVVDGGSTDSTLEILRRYEGKLSWSSERDGGQADAINKGLRACSGDVVAWINSDDVLRPGALQRVAEAFKHPSTQWLHGRCDIIDENDRTIRHLISAYKHWSCTRYSYSRLLTENFVSQMTVFWRRSLMDQVGMLDQELNFAFDYDLWLRFSTRYEFAFIDEATYFYRQWPGQMSHNQAKRFDCAMMIMRRFLEQNPGLVDPAKVHEAWAHTFVARGNSVWRGAEKSRTQALGFYVKALKESPLYGPAWRAIAKVALPDAAVRLVQRTIGDGV